MHAHAAHITDTLGAHDDCIAFGMLLRAKRKVTPLTACANMHCTHIQDANITSFHHSAAIQTHPMALRHHVRNSSFLSVRQMQV